MTQLNNDVLALFINHVVDGHTLFSLLTVSKRVFRLACRALYRDPVFFIRQKETESREKSTELFLWLVLAISPAHDKDTNILRQDFNVQPSHDSPMLDYLSLIRVVRWENMIKFYIAPYSQRIPRGKEYSDQYGGRYDSESFTKHCLTKSVCFHQLENIVELEIQAMAINEYIQLLSRLSRLTRLHINCAIREIKDVYPQAIRLVKAFQLRHGQDRLQECHVKESPWGLNWDCIPLHLELGSLLPIPRVLKCLDIHPLRPMDRYLVQLRAISISSEQSDTWVSIASHYRDLSTWRILQRCRALTTLTVENKRFLIGNSILFAWAAQEALDRAAGRSMLPAVPLYSLTLVLTTVDLGGARKLIKDALVGFRGSLVLLHVDFQSRGAMSLDKGSEEEKDSTSSHYPVSNEIQALPRLERIFLSSIEPHIFDSHLLEACPNLEELTVEVKADSDRKSLLDQPWPQLHHLNLVSLSLEGFAVILFDPMSLTTMPRLECLHLVLEQHDTPSGWIERWTWDWNIPSLTSLCVKSDIQEWFRLKILRSCPRLLSLNLETANECTLHVQSELDDPCHDMFGQVTDLTIDGPWDISLDDIPYLLHHVLPCLTNFRLSVSDTMACQMIVTSYNHPKLKFVRLPLDQLSGEKREELGLYPGVEKSAETYGCMYLFDDYIYYRHQGIEC